MFTRTEDFRGEKLLGRYGSHYLLPPYISKQNKTKQKQEKREERSSTTVSQDPMVSIVLQDRRKVTILFSPNHIRKRSNVYLLFEKRSNVYYVYRRRVDEKSFFFLHIFFLFVSFDFDILIYYSFVYIVHCTYIRTYIHIEYDTIKTIDKRNQ
ncbi:hypothetical protein V1478_003634 [Vespula squamosa]|uniref:Uncharacterized protein n=1 Tax=Vespula squamosa TaxID=30214 RepID=A0ABD2BMD7_VESSQ